jgi:hypothetical protein
MTMKPMRLFRALPFAIAGGLLLAAPARAAETPAQEIGGLFKCAAALGMYGAMAERPGAGMTDADKALAASVTAYEPQLRGRVDTLAPTIGEDGMKALIAAVRVEVSSKVDPLKDDPQAPRKILDLFKPVLEACVVRAKALPAA